MLTQRISRLALIAATLFGSVFVSLPVSAATLNNKMAYPVDMKNATITEDYSWKHTGIDITPLVEGEHLPVVAAADGIVTVASSCPTQQVNQWEKCNGGYGDKVMIKHVDGYQTAYAHLSRIDVKVGDHVTVGQQLGLMGDTGATSGVHLHFEVYAGSHGHESPKRMDPRKVLPQLDAVVD